VFTDIVLAFSLFAFVTSVTPGPNNLMVLASGINFGFRASIPHIFGISTGFSIMMTAVGLGLAEVFTYYPFSYTVMKWVGAAYLLYLAWNIAKASPLDSTAIKGRNGQPMSFLGAAAFQWVNPKAWVMAIGALSNFVPATSGVMIIVSFALLFFIINAPSVSIWAAFGARMRQILQTPSYRRAFNYSMAALLIASFAPILFAS
jgi:threonine/homoserine/homoserine lactone efflux protein